MRAITLAAGILGILAPPLTVEMARAQGCGNPPQPSRGPSSFVEWRAWCSRYGTPVGTNLYNAHCNVDPNWCRRNSNTNAAPPPPPNNPEAEHEAEVAAERAREEERTREAAEKKRKQEEFEREKEEAVRSLKGVSSDDLNLKGVGSATIKDDNTTSLGLKGVGDSTGSLGLKGIDDTRSSGLSDINRIYWRTVSVPAACVIAGQLKGGDACAVVDAYQLLKTLKGPGAAHEFEKLLLEKAATKAMVLSLGGALGNLERELDLIRAMYQAEAQIFDEICRRITNEMMEDPVKQAWMKEEAKLDEEAIRRLKEQIFAERQANVQASADYLQRNPNSQGVRFNCSQACRQLIQAAQGTNIWQ